jgi:O-acetyl-ADP-ribose deacetylase (regulator of RNase III)
MSLKYKVGDLIEAAKSGEVNLIAHGCNCYNTMGSGIAPLVARAFPRAYEADQETEKGSKAKLGKATFAYDYDHKCWVFNLYSQFGYWGRNRGQVDLSYEALEDAIDFMRDIGFNRETLKIGLPKVGAGLAGGDWKIIERIIKERLVDYDYDVTIYVLDPKEIPQGREIL